MVSMPMYTLAEVQSTPPSTLFGEKLFDDGWQFTYEGKTIHVDLPHDWDIFFAPNPSKGATGTGGGWFPGGKGEYRKSFVMDNLQWDANDALVKIHFEGVYQKAIVTVNGHAAGQHAYGYTPFTVDVTPYLHKDNQPNELSVTVDNSEQPNCRWYSGSGIYRHVWLQTMPNLHIAENGVFISTHEVSEGRATLFAEVTIENESDLQRKPPSSLTTDR